MGEIRRFEPHERAVFPIDEEGLRIVRAIKTLPADTPAYASTLESLITPHIPEHLGCASQLLRDITLVANNAMARMTHVTEGGFRRRREYGHAPESVASLEMARRGSAPLWLISQALEGTIDPPWAPEVLARLRLMGTNAVATELDMRPSTLVRNLKATYDPTLSPITFVQGGIRGPIFVPAWLPEQFANYSSPAL
jgi:hypothetical protein